MDRLVVSVSLVAAALLAAPALAVTPRVSHEYGQEYVTIGRPGNRAALPEERFFNIGAERLGRVNHRYRIATTEVTASQWLGFVEAFDPIWLAAGNTRFDRGFTSNWIRPTSYDPTQPAEYYILPGAESRAVETTWRLAAQYVNWLNNGQSSDPSAFASGAYDTSTFIENADGSVNDQIAHTPGAQFWLPTMDEWVKAAHYDPDRHGEGQDGYWLRQGSQDEALIPGLPENGGETSGGNFLPVNLEKQIPIGSYPDILSPWGLLDTSGGASEWTETAGTLIEPASGPHSGARFLMGSSAGGGFYDTHDLIDIGLRDAMAGLNGIRVAAAVPAPGGAMLGAVGALFAMRRRRGAGLVSAVLLGAAGSSALAVTPRVSTSYGIDFVTVGSPGNRAALPEERYYNNGYEHLGRVNHRYRLSRTEVDSTQWIQFLNAYWPSWEAQGGHPDTAGFAGGWIHATTTQPGVDPGYYIVEGGEHLAVKVNWRVAAAYCNWLHNGQVNESWAFESGAYDTSTFGGDNVNGFTDQPERSPGARFWLPTVDEWVKAAHYDPDRYGEGLDGYWLRKNGQDEPLTPGLPEDGGETSAGDFLPSFDEQFINVGSYPDIDAPWGVLDVSGGVREWTETIQRFNDDGTHNGHHLVLGSQANQFDFAIYDIIDRLQGSGSAGTSSRFGIRIAAAVPAPGGAMLGAAGALLAMRRRRRGAALVSAVLLGAAGSSALAVTPRVSHEYGQEYVTIGRPGNRAALPEERFFNIGAERLGRVNHRYRIATTEVTASQWLGFVEAFDPIWIAEGGTRFDTGFTSSWIRPTNYNPGQPAEYYILPGAENRAIETKWRLAAQYINWLNNGQSSDPSAFASGAYDTSTFTENADGSVNDQIEHTPGAQFWLPTMDEWVKAAHYDPDRHGEGQDGYWLRQGSQDEALIPGLPENGGETSGGNFLPVNLEKQIPVGSYPDILSPWGLLDTSGGASEWTETAGTLIEPASGPHSGARFQMGSFASSGFYDTLDLIDHGLQGNMASLTGIRVVARVPNPSTALLGAAGALFAMRRRRGAALASC